VDMPAERVGEPAGAPRWHPDPGVLSTDVHALIGAIGVGVMIYDADGRIVDANPAALELIGFDLAEIEGRRPRPAIPMSILPDGEPIQLDDLPVPRSLREGRPIRDQLVGLRRTDGTLLWLLVSAWPLVVDGEGIGAVATITDHSETREVEQAERTVTSATQVLVRTTDENALLQAMCQAIVEAGDYALAWIGRAENDDARSITMLAGAGAVDYVTEGLVTWSADDERGNGPTGTSVRTWTVQVCDDVHQDARLQPWQARMATFGFGSSVSVPIELGKGDRGVLTIYAPEIHAFEGRSLPLLVDLARDLEYGLRHLHTTEALATSEERFRLLAENTGDVVIVSRDGVIEWISPSIEGNLGWAPTEVVGLSMSEFSHPEDADTRLRVRSDVASGLTNTYRGRVRCRDGSWLWVDVRARAGIGADMVSTMWNTTAEVTAQEALAHAASHDALTGLANRSLLLSELDHSLAASRRSGLPTAVLLLDLDHFKYVNDSLGHAIGDELLCAAASRMIAAVRAGDVVARPGGDEFVVVMRNLADPAEALAVAERLTESFRDPIVVGDAELFSTASVGVAVATSPDQDALDLLREADTAMYQAKEEGRDRVSIFNEELRDSVTRRLHLANELRTALERDELAVWFQPEVGLGDNRVRAVEALLRWHHPSGELYTADRFIETAEETGLILDIGRWVLQESCAHAARWVAARPDHPLVVRVNLSSLQLAEAGLLEDLDEALADSGLDPRRLCVEITETAMLHETSTVRSNMAGIHRRGIRVAIDDFGTGYASLTYLRRYPVDVVKLDRSFVMNVGVRPQDEHIVAGIIELARRLGISVTAEGVERADQAELLRGLGCSGAQGYLYSKAVPPDQLQTILDDDAPMA
jgi:diguanylate cyclase (GGDEF)-like protein/PAS domain S-box-containing protein